MANPIDNAIEGAAQSAASGALGELDSQTLPQVQADVQADLNSAIAQLSNVIHGALVGIQATVDSLNGWTVTVSLPPIQIGPVTVVLRKP